MPGAGSSQAWGYRPQLDALRALAVYLVVAFHAGITGMANGFVGVDVFFVLSGYLVTSLLLRSIRGPGGRVGFAAFYSRRARRLLPAAAVNLIATALVFGAIAAPIEFAAATDGIRAAALYVANWFFIRESADYFAADVASNPVLHYWSLSVEEQFYLLWPLVLTAVVAVARRTGRHAHRVTQAMVGFGALASVGWALHLASTNLDRAYYGTDTRAYQLLAGASVALIPGIAARVHRLVHPVVLAGATAGLLAAIAALATSLVGLGPITRGIGITAATVALLVTMDAAPGTGVVRAVMSWRPLTYLGQISYGTYLWHWLVIIVLTRETELGSGAIAAVTAVCATGIASLSYQILEQPIRTSTRLDRRRPAVLSVAVVASLLVGLVIGPGILDRATGAKAQVIESSAAVGGASVPSAEEVTAARADNYAYPDCEVSGPTACLRTPGTGGRAIVVGESHAGMLTPMLQSIAERHDLELWAGYLSYCPWARGIRYQGAGPNCLADQDDLFDRILPELDPDLVFLAQRAIDDPQDPVPISDADEGNIATQSAKATRALDRRVTELVTALRRDGRTVIVFEPIPVAPTDENPLTCLSAASNVATCRFVASDGPMGEEQAIRRLAEEDTEVIRVDLDSMACPFLPICDPVVDGKIVRRDTNHLTVSYATSFADEVDAYLDAQGVWD